MIRNRKRAEFDRVLERLTEQCMAVLDDTEECAQDEDYPMREGTYNIYTKQMRGDRDGVIVIRDAMNELGAWKAGD